MNVVSIFLLILTEKNSKTIFLVNRYGILQCCDIGSKQRAGFWHLGGIVVLVRIARPSHHGTLIESRSLFTVS